MKTLKLQQLIDARACPAQVEEFRRRFGDRVEVTTELAESVAGDFDFRFAARHFLSPAAWAEFERARSAAVAEYWRTTAPAMAEFKRRQAQAFARLYGDRA